MRKLTFLVNELKNTITVWERGLHCSIPDVWARRGESSGKKTIRYKLHTVCQAFFQKLNRNFTKTGVWYLRWSVGKNNIVNFMRVISEKAGLSSNNTNHFMRVTKIRVMAATSLMTVAYVACLATGTLTASSGVMRDHCQAVVQDEQHAAWSWPHWYRHDSRYSGALRIFR